MAKENVIWMNTHFPPLGIGNGVHVDKGIGDMIAHLLAENLKNYTHTFQRANLKRILYEIEKGQNVCIAALIKNDQRSQFAHYSNIPTTIVSPLSIIINKDDVELFGNKTEVSLIKLLDDKNLTLGLPAKMSFSDEIDPILKKYKGVPNIQFFSSAQLIEPLLTLIASGRLHYTITYSSTAGFLASKLGMNGTFRSLNIIENKTPIIHYVACPKNEWGMRVTKEIDGVLKRIRHTAEYRDILEFWMIKENIEEYRKLYDEVFLKMK